MNFKRAHCFPVLLTNNIAEIFIYVQNTRTCTHILCFTTSTRIHQQIDLGIIKCTHYLNNIVCAVGPWKCLWYLEDAFAPKASLGFNLSLNGHLGRGWEQ